MSTVPTTIHVEDRGPQILAVGYTIFATSLISTLLRIYVRLRMVKCFGLDDWFMVAAIVSFTCYTIFGHIGVIHGTGRHFLDLELDDVRIALRYWWLGTVTFGITMITAKISIALFLLRVVVTKLDTWLIYVTAGINVLSMVGFTFVSIFQCKPVSFFWNRLQSSGTCIDIKVITALTYFNSTLSFISDFTFAIVALMLVWKLNMSWQKKAVLSPILSMGFLASVAVAVRFAYVEKFKDPDFLWATMEIGMWSSMEQGLAITASSLATLRPLARLVGKTLGQSWWGQSEAQDTDLPKGSRSRWQLHSMPNNSARYKRQHGRNLSLSVPKRPERCVISQPYSPSSGSIDYQKALPPSPDSSLAAWYFGTRGNVSEEGLSVWENGRVRRMNSTDVMITTSMRIREEEARGYI